MRLDELLGPLGVTCSNEQPDLKDAGQPALMLPLDLTGDSLVFQRDSDDLGGSAIENNQMIIRVNAPNTIQYTTLREPIFDDFRLQVDLTSLDGAEAVSYGVLFRMNDRNEFYRFEITGDGRFMVEKANADGSWLQYLDNWKKADSIEIGKDAWNTLRVDAIGSELKYYVNNSLVYSMTDDFLAVGNIGLDIGAFGQSSASAAFDNLIVHNP